MTTSPGWSRRQCLRAGLSVPAALTFPSFLASTPLRVSFLGQSLVHTDLRGLGDRDWPGRRALMRHLCTRDAVISQLESAIHASSDSDASPAETPTRCGQLLHAAPASVLDGLQSLGITFVTTAGNHAWDMGTGGIIRTLDALDQRGIAHAGTGQDLATACTAGRQDTGGGGVAIVAAATGAIRDGAAATPTRPGVFELRHRANCRDANRLCDDDVALMLDNIRAARQRAATRKIADVIVASLHNHYWEKDWTVTPPWQRHFARQCIDAGASIFVAHGPPVMHALETYADTILLHGMGNFLFQTRRDAHHYPPEVWHSRLVDATFLKGKLVDFNCHALRLQRDRRLNGGEFVIGTPAFSLTA